MTQAKPLYCDTDAGRVLSDRAGGADAPEPVPVSALSGAHPSRGRYVTCASCGGAGIVSVWSFGVKEPDECSGCYGSGRNWRYLNGMVAKHYAGPFVGSDRDFQTGHPIAPGVTGEG